jgi:non-specific serine/threonine protein kinase
VLILHAWWRVPSGSDDGALVVWGEDPAGTGPARSLPRRPGRVARGEAHPFAADAAQLSAALALPLDLGDRRELTLPTLRGRPQASPELVSEEDPPAGAVRAAVWSVPVLELDPATALEVLLAPLAGEVAAGSTWRHLVTVAAFADELAARGRTLPVVLTPPASPFGVRPWGGRAVWRPLVTGADAAWSRALALALPPAGLAADSDPSRTPADVVACAVDALADAAVRRRLSASGTAPARAISGPAWLAALVSPGDGSFEASAGAVAALSAELARWERDVVGGPARARFRLVEPPEGAVDELWQLEFALQSTVEPSLIAPAADVWTTQGAASALARLVPAPRQALLTELGRANRLYPELERALRAARPEVLVLDTVGAHAFLRDAAPVLAAAGFGVDLPGWWGRPAARLGARLKASARTQPGVVAGGAAIGARPGSGTSLASPSANTDAGILNLFLRLERVQEAFYTQAIRDAGLDGALLAFARAVQTQEHEHVAFLDARLGSKARKQPASDFGELLSSPERFRAAAIELEEAAIAAYIGQAANLSRPLVASIATLVSVEARQVAWLRDIAGISPAPRAADPAQPGQAVLADLKKRGLLR